jgi:hypothetical protein
VDARPLIIWTKWQDPYGENMDDVEYPGFMEPIDPEPAKSFDMDDNPMDDGTLELLEIHELQQQQLFNNTATPVVGTPMGMVPMTEYTRPSKIFNMWLAHTNFNITAGVFELVEKIPGVELLDTFTRYRMRVGVGVAFNDSKVLRNINKALHQYLEEIGDESGQENPESE